MKITVESSIFAQKASLLDGKLPQIVQSQPDKQDDLGERVDIDVIVRKGIDAAQPCETVSPEASIRPEMPVNRDRVQRQEAESVSDAWKDPANTHSAAATDSEIPMAILAPDQLRDSSVFADGLLASNPTAMHDDIGQFLHQERDDIQYTSYPTLRIEHKAQRKADHKRKLAEQRQIQNENSKALLEDRYRLLLRRRISMARKERRELEANHLEATFKRNDDNSLEDSVRLALDICQSEGYDLGQTCSFFRRALSTDRKGLDSDKLATFADRERERRHDDINIHLWQNIDNPENRIILNPRRIPPRRIWDLRSNRVIPFDSELLKNAKVWAISHSWVDESERTDIATEINNYEWPVPVPKGTSLENIRSYLLENLKAEYCWLDILCLRQDCPGDASAFEDIRKQEWEIDIPTIGNVYLGEINVLRYYNGLGKRFSLSGWSSERHWTNRPWTLQETKANSHIGGLEDINSAALSEIMTHPITDGRYRNHSLNDYERLSTPAMVSRLLEFPSPLWGDSEPTADSKSESDQVVRSGIFDIIREIRARIATYPVDIRIAGIGLIADFPTLPTYSQSQDAESAWRNCVTHMQTELKEDLLFLLPFAYGSISDTSTRWFPTWKQMETMDLPEDEQSRALPARIVNTSTKPPALSENPLQYSYYGEFIDQATLNWSPHACGVQCPGLPTHATGTIRLPGGLSLDIVASPVAPGLSPSDRNPYSFLKREDSSSLIIARKVTDLNRTSCVILKKLTVASLTPKAQEDWCTHSKDIGKHKECVFPSGDTDLENESIRLLL
ncbi:hypothetical protein BJ508DRAFT_362849 [Ascobolus immersus RN42]|uniref:Heterokaryon incompatibility domain-containing protein n=1 Tax=Ascobolus immersus RN42 TaxID=1160509 RepID=A0A3N4I1I6_ASCIM|nr:hypothetical protein BJ508DRAFT_362849 [Ascobolus immersus RN42]